MLYHPNINYSRISISHMSIWKNMDLVTKILMAAGLFSIVWGYLGTIVKNTPPTPIDYMSIGLGLIGIALVFSTMKKS
jgi:energy-converting hydrogenase Eha subunit E